MLRDIKCNCECGGKYTLPHKTKHEKTKLHQSMLHNKPIQTKTKRTTCECGCSIVDVQYDINEHKLTDKHKRFMEISKTNNNDEYFI